MLSENEFAAIQDAAKVQTVEIDGVTYTSVPVHDVRKAEPEEKRLEVSTLAGLAEFIAAHPEAEVAAAHICSHQKVELLGKPFGRFRQRNTFAVATDVPTGLSFNAYIDSELMTIQLLATYVQTEECAALLRFLGSIDQVASQTTADDGVTQTVTLRKGIVRKGEEQAPVRIELKPYRTFREVDQPASPFVLRLRAGSPPTAALFEADAGTWKLEAIAAIKTYLRGALPETVRIIG